MVLWDLYLERKKHEGGESMKKCNVKAHYRKVKGKKTKVRVRGHRRKK